MIRVLVCRCVQVCAFVCWNPTFQPVFFGSACCCCYRIMSSVSHRPSSSQAFYFVADTVQQQSHSKFVWITTHYACVDIVYECVLRACTCVQVCALVCWNPTFQLLVFILLRLCCCCRIMSRLYHTVPLALKLSTLWQIRYNSNRTASLCGPPLTMGVLTGKGYKPCTYDRRQFIHT